VNIDIRTLFIVLIITNFLQASVIFIQYLINKTYQGICWWVLGHTSLAIGFTLMLLRDFTSIELITIILANSLLMLGFISIYIGSMRFLDKKENRGIIIPVFAVFILSYFYFTYVNNDITIRSIIIAGTIAIVSFLTALDLFVNKASNITASANFLSAILLGHSCFFVLRAVVLIFAPIDIVFTPTLMQTVLFLFQLIEGTLLTFGLIIMVNQRLNAEMRDAKEDFELIFNTGPDAFIITRTTDNLIVDINERFTALTGFTWDETIGKSILAVNFWKDPAEPQKIIDELSKKGSIENFEALFQRKDGSRFVGSMSTKTINVQGIPYTISVTRDITERKQMEQKLHKMATHDFLTGLPNRALLLDRFIIAAALANRNKSRLVVMSLDLDNFKSINDTLGHHAGDQALKVISTRLTGVTRASDTLARLGGDEFILMMLETGHAEDATAIAQKILDSFTEPLSIEGHQLHLSTSIGIAIYPEDGEDLETLTKKADTAMYYSKGHGRNQFKFFADGDV